MRHSRSTDLKTPDHNLSKKLFGSEVVTRRRREEKPEETDDLEYEGEEDEFDSSLLEYSEASYQEEPPKKVKTKVALKEMYNPSVVFYNDEDVTEAISNCRSFAQGGFGTIYNIIDSNRNLVAKKIPLSPTNCFQLFKEVRLNLKLSHPHILQLHGFTFSDEFLFLFYEKMFGLREFLKSLLERRKSFGKVGSINILAQVASAMEYLHEKNILHRDLKIDNILVMDRSENIEEVRVFLCDFGISVALKEDEKRRTMAGTLSYMAPEVMRKDQDYGKKADVYSFALLCYCLFSSEMNPYPPEFFVGGKYAFTGRVIRGERPNTMEIRRTHGTDIANFIELCWDDNPQKRPSFSGIVEMIKQWKT